MWTVAFLTLQKVAMLLLFISVGFVLRISKKLPDNAGKVLSMLCTLVFTPAYTINNLANNMTIATLSQKSMLFAVGTVITVLSILLATVLGKLMAKEPFYRKSLTYAFAIPNYGYFGYPVVEGVFGAAALSNMLVFVIPLSVATNSWGYLQFSKEKKLSIKKILLAPMIVAVIIGLVIGLTGLKLPSLVTDVLSGAGSCMSPASMLLAGFVLGGIPLKKLFVSGKAYMMAALRLVLIPLIFAVPMYLLGIRGELFLFSIITLSLPLGLNLVVYPESYGYDATENAQMCFGSYILSIIILPITFAIINFLAFS